MDITNNLQVTLREIVTVELIKLRNEHNEIAQVVKSLAPQIC